MVSIVTTTVAACLERFEVGSSKYKNIEKSKEPSSLRSIPTEEELASLVKGGCFWSTSGLQRDDACNLLGSLHQYDFICLQPEGKEKQIFDIAQILSVPNRQELVLKMFIRMEHTLLREDSNIVLRDLRRIKCKCWVGQPGSNDGYFTTIRIFPSCTTCQGETDAQKMARERVRRLRTLSLFGGSGGMDIGLSFSNFRTDWMVDLCSSACETFRRHHPNAIVIQKEAGQALMEMGLTDGLPHPGQVDCIAMGPPCQPFSKMNRQSKEERENDPRSMCIATGLAFVERYMPSYGVIENVCGILENGNLGIAKETGIVKFAILCLSTLEYNLRFGMVQCSAFGVPQTRKRVVILFSKQGLTLPNIPRVTHGTIHEVAFYPAISIHDATSDLPRWDLQNQGIYCPARAQLKESRIIVPPSFELKDDGTTTGPKTCRYTSIPTNVFQEKMRCTGSDFVEQHYVIPFLPESSLSIERIWNIPAKPGSNHLSLQGPTLLAVPELQETKDERVFENAFGRLDANGLYPIVMTNIVLKGKTGRVLMPDQHRIPSIRELARAQGFPDGISFQGTPQEMLSQIGNAVPIPLAIALGESITNALVTDFLQGDIRFARKKRS